MKIFIDFDDVIFNTKDFITDFNQVFFSNGVSEKVFNKYIQEYRQKRDSGQLAVYSFKEHLKSFEQELDIDFRKLKKDALNLIKKSDKYVFEDFYDFAAKINCGRNSNMGRLKPSLKPVEARASTYPHTEVDLYLLSYGNKKFQKLKIKNSGVAGYFKKVLITEGLKSEQLTKLLKKDYTNGNNCYFLDDRVEKLQEVKSKFSGITTILVQRKEGRYFDEKGEGCDFVVDGLDEALEIINRN